MSAEPVLAGGRKSTAILSASVTRTENEVGGFGNLVNSLKKSLPHPSEVQVETQNS